MKKFIYLVLSFALLAIAAVAFAQGKSERYGDDKTEAIDGMATRSITNYYHTKAAITIPITATGVNAVSKYCLASSGAGTVQINGTGGTKTIAANTDFCRTVKKGVTSIVFTGASSAVKTIAFERQY